MNEFLRYALLGLGTGAVYGLSAQGLVLIFLGNRVLNFAQGAVALLSAYTFFECTTRGLPLLLGAAIALVVAASTGAIIELAVMRPLRHTSSVTKLVATIGLLTVIQSAAALHYGDTTKFVKGLLPNQPWLLTDTLVIGQDRAWVLVIALVITVVLVLGVGRTRLGIATVATAENPTAVEVLGWSARTISLANWVLGSILAGLAGILVAPMNGLSVSSMSQVVYCALAAALIGGFRSFGWAMVGGLLLGVAQAEAVRIHGDVGWSTAIPFIVIVAAVLVRGDVVRGRAGIRRRLSSVGSGDLRLGSVMVAVVVAAGVVLLSGHNAVDALATSLVVALIGLSVVVATGYAGELSLAQYALAGLGALSAVTLAGRFDAPFLVALVGGSLAGLGGGVAVGLLSLRVRGDVVAIITVGVALAVQALVLENPRLTGGISGLAVPSPTLFGLSVDAIEHPRRFATVCLAACFLAAMAVMNLRRGNAGRRLLAIRSGERAASVLGISVPGAKLYALALAGGLAGVAGALFAFRQSVLTFEGFTVDASMTLLGAVVLAGAGYVAAGVMGGFAVSGGLVYYVLTLTGGQQYLPVALGVVLLLNLVLAPDGIVPANGRMIRALARKLPTLPRRDRRAPDSILTPPAVARPSRPPAGLELRDLTVQFGGVTAIDGVSLTVEPGRVEGLIGPNGAGKTTLIDAVTGVTRGYAGQVLVGGVAVDRWSAARRARVGLGRTLQGLELFEELTVFENLLIGSDSRGPTPYAADLVRPRPRQLSGEAWIAVDRFGLVDALDQLPGELPYGRRRLVAIARALAACPSVLLLDEPAAGLSARERDELGTLIRELVDSWGMTVLLVEHDVDLVMRVSDHVTVLEFGGVIARGEPAAIRADREVRRAFLGEEVSA
ncbi:amino acid/amide ABC transporter membrane protein 1, HAAT family /amino acid/amide ABC transporter membrane protein 2, HAAT family /amino acid/amide ABC transporter ATP-binding protein 1, HAAT family [Nocardioides sp. YR527]|uniref:branched-chain amino acid ABC transporter permease/ATP-binding protein n=1 Tax=Nocardioides sp. YR527 TaxID=1881028 RepID=UPI000891F334|nr:branched-chain amino acid ABC transporter permease/ATP-binding protein [Nocardioides sp. YR527]SDL32157.1 amino acid/amide ABC transporter membrane protein 1, HAAT family /amino acid/amide ABC transporter membrane protein 2, HAAT family /amino acid/amide ABC transporter ATP-binding protein 1, HAAT family [Nocardioides sp. YR527]